ncbi:MAG: helix-turn-helix domain-containing protein [Fusobacteriaceae bacterium]
MDRFKLTEEQKKVLKIEDERVEFYFKVENAIIDDSELFSDTYELCLYMVLSRFCNNKQYAFPSYSKLAEICHCSRRTIIKAMASLEKKGYVNKICRLNGSNEKINNTNLYTINNIKKYTMENKNSILKSLNSGECGALGVVQDIHQGGAPLAPYKELTKKNKIKKNKTTTRDENNIDCLIQLTNKNEKTSSSIFEFLDLEEFKKINNITKKNIRKNIKELSIQKLREVYKKSELVISNGRATSFDAVLYKGLNDEWNFLNIISKEKNINSSEAPTILEKEKQEWLEFFGGIKSDPTLYEYVKKQVIKIPIDILKNNKNRLRSCTTIEFKNFVSALAKQI